MLTREQNKQLTEVGSGTPLGELLRRYWIPVALSSEIGKSGGAPVRVRVLGESLVAFRDPNGVLGLLEEFCPHRGASLTLARNEPGGLRCIYHGWKINAQGAVVETPPEPPESTFSQRICHANYSVREAGGVLWAYMGPAEKRPPFPKFPWLGLSSPHLLVVKMFQDCNWLQGAEGDMDPAHPNYLHRDMTAPEAESWDAAGWDSVLALMADGAPRIYCEDSNYLMRSGSVRKTADSNISYVRLTEYIAPFYSYVASAPGESQVFKAWIPIDDRTCYTLYVHFDHEKPLDEQGIFRNWGHHTAPPDFRVQYQQHRENMTRNFSGISGAAIQDLAVQESMGPIYDRTKEHLGASDRSIIHYRRLLLRLIRDAEEGKPLPAQDPTLSFAERSVVCLMPADRPWQEAMQWWDRQAEFSQLLRRMAHPQSVENQRFGTPMPA